MTLLKKETNLSNVSTGESTTEEIRVEYVLLDTVLEWESNPKQHDDDGITASFTRFGYVEPMVVDEKTGKLTAGHGRRGRLKAMQDAGKPPPKRVKVNKDGKYLVPVIRGVSFKNAKEAEAYLVASNRLTEGGGWDNKELLALISADDFDLDGVGYSDKDIAALRKLVDPHVGTGGGTTLQDDVPAVPKKPITKRGDLIYLGGHALLCGDATAPESYKKLFGSTSKKVDLVMTDPPYGVAYVGKTKNKLTVKNDDPKKLKAIIQKSFPLAAERCRPGGIWYVHGPPGPNFLVFANMLSEMEILRQTIIWAKDVFVLGHSDFHYKHEIIFYGWMPGRAHRTPPDRKQTSVWEFARPKVSRDHPTMKPLPMAAYALGQSTIKGDVVLDPFGGSGTTLIACQDMGRFCKMIEWDPGYCDVIVKRWEAFTGKKAKRPVRKKARKKR